MPSDLASLLFRWKDKHANHRSGATDDELLAFEASHRLTLPSQFRNFLAFTNGTDHMDENWMHFLSLEEIANKVKEGNEFAISRANTEIDLVFADFLIWSHWYLLRFERNGTFLGVFATGGFGPTKIASAFDEFISGYLEDPTRTMSPF